MKKFMVSVLFSTTLIAAGPVVHTVPPRIDKRVGGTIDIKAHTNDLVQAQLPVQMGPWSINPMHTNGVLGLKNKDENTQTYIFEAQHPGTETMYFNSNDGKHKAVFTVNIV